METDFNAPESRLGDQVYWYSDADNPRDPVIGWISRQPGERTVDILAFVPFTGFIEKSSVRHKDDPGLKTNPSWKTWGCWEFSPAHKDMQRARTVVAQVALNNKKT